MSLLEDAEGSDGILDTYRGVLDVFCICGHDKGWHVKHKENCCYPQCDCDSFREKAILSDASDNTLSSDGITLRLGDRVLVKNQTNMPDGVREIGKCLK